MLLAVLLDGASWVFAYAVSSFAQTDADYVAAQP